PRHLHAFPTRRSSDLCRGEQIIRPVTKTTLINMRHSSFVSSVCFGVVASMAIASQASALSLTPVADTYVQINSTANNSAGALMLDRKSTRLNSSHVKI